MQNSTQKKDFYYDDDDDEMPEGLTKIDYMWIAISGVLVVLLCGLLIFNNKLEKSSVDLTEIGLPTPVVTVEPHPTPPQHITEEPVVPMTEDRIGTEPSSPAPTLLPSEQDSTEPSQTETGTTGTLEEPSTVQPTPPQETNMPAPQNTVTPTTLPTPAMTATPNQNPSLNQNSGVEKTQANSIAQIKTLDEAMVALEKSQIAANRLKEINQILSEDNQRLKESNKKMVARLESIKSVFDFSDINIKEIKRKLEISEKAEEKIAEISSPQANQK